MYDELIKNLRICSRCDFGQDCNGCTQKSDDEFCCDKLLHEAADAIEELSKKYLESEVDNTNLTGWLAEEHAKHLWIPVTERLPEERCDYLVFAVGGAWRQISSIEIAYWDGDRFRVQSFNAVTHWMPLPEPPPKDGES